jgi:hypothetical protein
MAINCKNCNQQFEGYFCNHCGQTADTHEINFHFLWHDIQHGLLHFDKGVLYTAKQLFTRPGNSIREFIEGKRVKHFKPVSLIIVLATVYGLLYHSFHINAFKDEVSESFQKGWNGSGTQIVFDFEKINEWIGTHYSWLVLLLLPFYALGSFLAFRKSGYNYVEHLILNAFITGQNLLVHIILFPLLYLYNETPTYETISTLINTICFVLLAWSYMQFFRQYSKTKTFFLILLSYLYFGVSVFFAFIIGGLILGYLYSAVYHYTNQYGR